MNFLKIGQFLADFGRFWPILAESFLFILITGHIRNQYIEIDQKKLDPIVTCHVDTQRNEPLVYKFSLERLNIGLN